MFDDHDAISLSDDWTDPGLQNVLDDHQHQHNRLPHCTGLSLNRETDNVSSSKPVDNPTLNPNPLPPLDPTLTPGGLPDAAIQSQARDPTHAVLSQARDPTPAVLSLEPPPSSSVHRSTCTRTAPTRWGYDEMQGAWYEAISTFGAFVANADHAQAYSAFLAGDSSTETYNYRDPLVYQASIHKDPDLPVYVEALMGPDCKGFYEEMRQEIKELESKEHLDTYSSLQDATVRSQNSPFYMGLPPQLISRWVHPKTKSKIVCERRQTSTRDRLH